MVTLDDLFTTHLSEHLTGYVARDSQRQFAKRVNNIIATQGTGIFEAGTGTGKTLAYLAPVFASDATAIVSTGTKTLQDQLFFKDVPVLQRIYPNKRVAMLKGRANYLCPHRLKRNIKLQQDNQKTMHHLTQIRVWSGQSKSGDLTEFVDAEEQAAILPLVTSTSDNCLGNRCPEFDACPLYLARGKAAESDIVIVNHHLLFSDLANREEYVTSLLPRVDVVVVDEAHQIHNIARQFFGQRLSSGRFSELIRDIRAELFLLGNDDPETAHCVTRLESVLGEFQRDIAQSDVVPFADWLREDNEISVHRLDDALLDLGERLRLVAERSEGLVQCTRRLFDLSDVFAMLTELIGADQEMVHWIEREGGGLKTELPNDASESRKRFTIHLTPMSIAADLSALVEESSGAWIFTSATLAAQGSFDLVQRELGLEGAETETFASPFDYGSMVTGIVPAGLPVPGSDEHTDALVEWVTPLIKTNQGRTFFLFTSYRALRLAAEVLALVGRPLCVQGRGSRANLLRSFAQEEKSVLLATQSFWEGVDVRGADLRLVIIDKLPFPNPSDPMFSAETRVLASAGQDSFKHLSLPRAALSLKQGFGRLIRTESDQGVFVLGDSRVRERSYGQYVLNSLPEFPWVNEYEQAVACLQRLRN